MYVLCFVWLGQPEVKSESFSLCYGAVSFALANFEFLATARLSCDSPCWAQVGHAHFIVVGSFVERSNCFIN